MICLYLFIFVARMFCFQNGTQNFENYAFYCVWHPFPGKRLARKIQTFQSKCIRYCLNFDNRAHVAINEVKKIDWLPTKERFLQRISVNIFKFFNNVSPVYMSEIFHLMHCAGFPKKFLCLIRCKLKKTAFRHSFKIFSESSHFNLR